MSRLCQCLQNFWALHAQDEAAALIQSSGGAAERENVPYVQVRRWQQLVKAALALGDAEWQVVGINVAPFSIEETALMLLVAEETRWVYVPVDVQLPLARQIEMVQNAGVHRLVTTVDSPLATFFASRDAARVTAAMEWRTVESTTSPFQFVQVLALSDCYFGSEREESLLGCKRRELAAENDGHEIAAPLYVLFTSGTTGKPRGVLGTRTGAWTRLKWMWTTYPFAENGERVLRATKLSFVDSVWEILGAFLRRVPLVHIQQPRRHHDDTFARQDVMKSVVLDDSALFLEVLRIEEVTRFTAIPSVLEILLLQTKGIDCQSTLAKLRYILSSGEILALHIAEKLTTVLPEVTLLNLYGSTEVSGDVTCMELKAPLTSAQMAEWQEREHYGASHAPHQVFVVSTHAVQRRAHGKIDRRALETLLSHGTGDSKILLRSSATDGRIPENLRSQTFSEIGANSLLSTLFVYELDQVFGSHRLGMTIREVLSTLDSWKEDRLREVPVISISPPSTHHGTRIRDKAFEGLDSESEIGSEVKRPKLLHRNASRGSVTSTWAIVGSHSAQLICVDVQNGTYTGSMFALELQSGKTRWSFHAKETIKSSAVVIDAHQLVIFGAYDNNLYGLDTVTGQERAAFYRYYPWERRGISSYFLEW
ncbi:non-ribosomal peptide synthetase [Phytophthora cinnamomi]|uniref:non-ribosomal peptide synthetase n=1 Tax=Phytophthora cinnamomi TaxID=4785 RepID=UPI003559781B|nr:non-ribosomal peptide synthetase [Phytophthora cinnamomi]